jgi:transposase-like protein
MTAINKTAKELPQLPAGLVEQLASFVNTEQALRLITNQLMKQVVERTLQAELSHHLDIDSATGNANSRHGFMADNHKPVLGFPVEYMC